MKISNSGNPSSPIWVIAEEPYSTDEDKSVIWSGGLGYVFRKIWSMASLPEPYIYVLKPTIGASYDDKVQFFKLLTDIADNAPVLILPVSADLFESFCPDLVFKSQKKAILKKYAGNLLNSRFISHPHFIIPQYPPDFIGANWDYHEIQANIDFGHVKEEYDFWRSNGRLNELPIRKFLVEPNYEQLMEYLYYIRREFSAGVCKLLSTDIETIRPKKGTYYHKLGHCGYPYTISLAPSSKESVSFSFWDYSTHESVKIWRELDWLLREIPQIGQNYFTFDAHFLEALGFKPCLDRCQDTLIRHHILWPSLEHKLQFQTKQYTREPFYKDEGKQWSPKYKAALMRYNCLDTCVTYEIFEAQELEFQQRSHLR